MKKIVIALLVAAFSFGAFCGCKPKQEGSKPAETKEAKPAAPAPTK